MRRKRRKDVVPKNARQSETRERALATISLMRREHLSLKVATKVEGIRPSTVLRYAGSALRMSKGDYTAKALDRIPRSLRVVGPKGMQATTMQSSRSASQIGRYMNAVKAFVRTGNQADLKKFKGKQVPGTKNKFVVSPSKLMRFADAGILDIEKLYLGAKGA
jgi:hypothetical protein